ncbi:hypothetical protein AX16_002439 [Volvariella volvacea WC 439]|nr:hypothetical protein AX16_002439 [Volvariella volvacea WC 439]
MALPSVQPVLGVAIVTALFLLSLEYLRSPRKRLPLPPAPPGYPFIGHYLSVPDRDQWIAYKKWGDECGSDIIYLNMLGTHMVILNSLKATKELFDRRSAIYSDRHPMPMMKLLGWDWNFAFKRYGPEWRLHRKLFKQLFSSVNHQEHELEAVRRMIHRLTKAPLAWEPELRHMAGEIIFNTAYGFEISAKNDPAVELSEKALYTMARAGNVGSFLVDFLPWLNKLPSWFPGAGYQNTAVEWSKIVNALPREPFEFAKEKFIRGELKSSVVLQVLEEHQLEGDPEKEQLLRNVIGLMYSGWFYRTVSAISSFLLVMVQNPELFKRAQVEVDKVTGGIRLPDFTDQDSLPFVHALVREALRWNPVTPLAIAHAATSDDTYNGYFIPNGSVVVGNSWAILHDESLYGSNTDRFDPDRFLDENGLLNSSVSFPEAAFGFGRRFCPGKDIGTSTVWITIATMLATLDITKAKDSDGKPIEPSGKYSSGMLCYPEPFPCDIRFRSRKAESLVEAYTT